jgi:hypothetical protein
MNTHGHEEVARTAGIPLLKEAFGNDNHSLDALYLGNWLTDVSQAVDPVAYASAAAKISSGGETVIDKVRQAADDFLDELLPTIFERLGPVGQGLRSLKVDLEPIAKEAKEALHHALDGLLAASGGERRANLAKFLRDAFLVKGYFKFVHPEASGQARMNFDGFMAVFGRPADTSGASGASPATDRPGSYTQYYPHEHLDRPEVLPVQDPPVFAPGRQTRDQPFRVAAGKRAGTRSPRRTERIEPDIYSYLRDDIEMTAGLLAEVDLAMQEALSKSFSADDPDWHRTLAKLGHALHQVEDFFAHSNWCELAHKRLGPSYLQKVLPPQLKVEMIDRASTTYLKRLKRHLTEPLSAWREHPDEDWVVTGFFDFRDTLISLAHISEELFGLDVPDPYAEGYNLYQQAKEVVEHPRTAVFKVQQTMRHTLDVLTDPKRAFEDPENDIAAKLKKEFGSDVNRLLRPGAADDVAQRVLQESAFLKDAPPAVKSAFFDVIVEGTRGYTAGRTAYKIHGVISEVSKFIGDPVAWLLDWLPGKLRDKIKDALKFYARERFYELVGAGRIGCHSLLAKDHGREPFFPPANECATAVHWWIVTTLLRWKGRPDAGYVDWLELLEYFLRNPLSPDRSSVREVRGWAQVTLVHTVRYKEQLKADNLRDSLEAIYQPSAARPGVFTWRSIADANFNTAGRPLKEAQDAINGILRDNAWGVPVTRPNYAFKPGLRILIPQQRVRVVFLVRPSDETVWFEEVFDKGWKVFRGIEDPEGQESKPPLKHHTPIEIPRKDLERLIVRGRKLRREAREAYRPPSSGT